MERVLSVKSEEFDELLFKVLKSIKGDMFYPNDKILKTKFKAAGDNLVADIKISRVLKPSMRGLMLHRIKIAFAPFLVPTSTYEYPDGKFIRLTINNKLGKEVKYEDKCPCNHAEYIKFVSVLN
jgi:hypothetical protein